ncbi:HPr family phosphocarrier protein [candidate division CSSED10-310 bacterium]|uniref:HPr family phosphocarrier protein n=1 Tax=candidate division CSSED10-310 bacterium TaxID=2855610 RepID=A0ABV6Z2X8_UNCC1
MKTMVVKVLHKSGLHARLAAELVQVTTQFAAQIEIENDNETVDGKSIMGILTLAAGYQTELQIRASGVDEVAAIQAITDVFLLKFASEE